MSNHASHPQDELDRLRAEHRRLDDQVAQLEARHGMTPADEMELKRLKHEKLRLKDQIAVLSANPRG